jgi:hypothetical protein
VQANLRWPLDSPDLFFVAVGLVTIGGLWSGPVQLTPHLSIDIHSLVVACFAIIVG